jgi:hypothetical protein
MIRRRRLAAMLVLGALTTLTASALTSPASAEVIQGPCTGSAAFSNGVVVTESQPLDQVVEVPDNDTVMYEGSVNIPEPSDPVPFDGGIDVRLPISGATIVTWSGETVEVSDAGDYMYTLPSFIPRGTGGLEVTARHTQAGTTCIVVVTMAVEGSPGTPALLGAAGTLVFFTGVVGAGFMKGRAA